MWRIDLIQSQRASELPDTDVGNFLRQLLKISEYVALFSRGKDGSVFENIKKLNTCMTRYTAQFKNTARFQFSTFQVTTASIEHQGCLEADVAP